MRPRSPIRWIWRAARLSLRFFDAMIDKEHGYEMYWVAFLNGPVHQFSPLMACQPKVMEAMAMARLMCGSTDGLDTEAKMLAEMASHIGDDGIFWVPKYTDRPWLVPWKTFHWQTFAARGE